MVMKSKTQVKKVLKTPKTPLTQIQGREPADKRCTAFAALPGCDLRFVLLALPG
jgi:hypothetical protein